MNLRDTPLKPSRLYYYMIWVSISSAVNFESMSSNLWTRNSLHFSFTSKTTLIIISIMFACHSIAQRDTAQVTFVSCGLQSLFQFSNYVQPHATGTRVSEYDATRIYRLTVVAGDYFYSSNENHHSSLGDSLLINIHTTVGRSIDAAALLSLLLRNLICIIIVHFFLEVLITRKVLCYL